MSPALFVIPTILHSPYTVCLPSEQNFRYFRILSCTLPFCYYLPYTSLMPFSLSPFPASLTLSLNRHRSLFCTDRFVPT
ncbi:hypothetical protein BDQ12DRAFT_530198 [Crucibulum laeve]|uniref:Uncharacterized protein n=1 Tax=Crucibulum laeve TaxID=68775 RepID=A0A5C3LTG9_9AGAR|nr:hypothetical protein BDQ12DRAFT_530198 [Crucibulum laeve]